MEPETTIIHTWNQQAITFMGDLSPCEEFLF